jgi:hypothetical protein
MPPTDNGSDKLNRFQAAFERGQKGNVGSFDIWLEEHGFIPERVERDTLTQYFQVTEAVKPFVQLRLNKEAEFNA